MIKWAYLFSSTIRSRGARYYRDGNVIKVVKQGNRFTASVRGEHLPLRKRRHEVQAHGCRVLCH